MEGKKAATRAKMLKDNDFAAARNARIAEAAGQGDRSADEIKVGSLPFLYKIKVGSLPFLHW